MNVFKFFVDFGKLFTSISSIMVIFVVEDLDSSIEIPRGGDDKKSGRGHPGRKVTKSSNQVKGEECTTLVDGTDTTEIPRSTTQANMQITMDRMRRAAPPRRLNKDPPRGEWLIWLPVSLYYNVRQF